MLILFVHMIELPLLQNVKTKFHQFCPIFLNFLVLLNTKQASEFSQSANQSLEMLV